MKKLSLSIMFLYVGLTIIAMYQGDADLAMYRGNTSILWFIIHTLTRTIDKQSGVLDHIMDAISKAEEEETNNKKKK